MRVGFVGLGIMGERMAANLVKAGHQLSVYDRNPRQISGARTASSPADAAQGAEVVWMSVSDTAAVEQVLFGQDGIELVVSSGMIVVDSSTISPSATRRFAERIRATGADYVDAPAIGSKAAAADGTVVFIVGGDDEPVARLQPLFGAMGKSVVRAGETGKAQAAKIAINLQIALIFEGFAEGLMLATKLGVDPECLIQLVRESMVNSGVVQYKAPALLQRDFSPHLPLRHLNKDLHLMLDAAREVRVKLPALEAVTGVYEIAVEEGLADKDYSASLLLLEKWAGCQIKS